MIEQALSKVKENIFIGNDNGKAYMIKPVDKPYTRKAPVYYLQELSNGKAIYLSGLFATDNPDVFSLDMKDRLGIKQYFTLTFSESGKRIEIKSGRYGRKPISHTG